MPRADQSDPGLAVTGVRLVQHVNAFWDPCTRARPETRLATLAEAVSHKRRARSVSVAGGGTPGADAARAEALAIQQEQEALLEWTKQAMQDALSIEAQDEEFKPAFVPQPGGKSPGKKKDAGPEGKPLLEAASPLFDGVFSWGSGGSAGGGGGGTAYGAPSAAEDGRGPLAGARRCGAEQRDVVLRAWEPSTCPDLGRLEKVDDDDRYSKIVYTAFKLASIHGLGKLGIQANFRKRRLEYHEFINFKLYILYYHRRHIYFGSITIHTEL